MKYFNSFLENVSSYDGEYLKTCLAAVEEEQQPPALQEFPGLELDDDGLWRWRGCIMPTRATMPAYRKRWRHSNPP